LLAIPCQSIHAQEVKHAPTVEECRADQKLWWAKLEREIPGIASVSFDELDGWDNQMIGCAKGDPEFETRYCNTRSEICGEMQLRLVRFLARHNLYGPFKAEDEQGKR
jgi:hypothetical protein